MKTGTEEITTAISGTATDSLIHDLPLNGINFTVILTHGSGSGAVQHTFTPNDYPGEGYRNANFAINYISGGGFSIRGLSGDQVEIKPYNTSGHVRGTFGYQILTKRGV